MLMDTPPTAQINDLEAQLAHYKNILLVLRDIGEIICAEVDIEKILKVVAKGAQQLIQAETLLVPILNAELTEYTYRAGYGKHVDEIVGESLPLEMGVCGWVWKNKQPWWRGVLDNLSDEERNRWEREANTVIIVPLVGKHSFLGGLAGINKLGEQDFDEKDLEILTVFAQQVSTSIENATLLNTLSDEIKRREKREHTLRLLTQVVDQSPITVIITNADNQIEYVNPAFTQILGYTLAEVAGKHPDFLCSERLEQNPYHIFHAQKNHLKYWQHEILNRKKNGDLTWQQVTISPITSEHSEWMHFVYVQEDISQRKDYEEKLIHQASFDLLTALPNRMLGYDRLKQALVEGKRHNTETALLYLDLDRFKSINDTLGHRYGDLLLIEAASRLQGSIRECDTVARVGGDEFLIILKDIEATAATQLADKIRQKVSEPYLIEGHTLHIGCSIGISLAPKDGTESNDLIRNADTALYHAKNSGRDTSKFFNDQLKQQSDERLLLDTEAYTALENNELEVYFQPIVKTDNQAIVGAEALMRWHSPRLGWVPADKFIPVFEHNGRIVEAGKWILLQACRIAKTWQQTYTADFSISVNISYVQFRQPDFVDMVRHVLEETQLPPHSLHLEITERLLLEDSEVAKYCFETLSALGIEFSIDDFGTGYSSLSYLKHFPCQYIKIDKRFIDEAQTSSSGAALVEAIIQMGHCLSREIIAEGVETATQARFLNTLCCEYIQGYFIHRPLSQTDFEALLRTQSQ